MVVKHNKNTKNATGNEERLLKNNIVERIVQMLKDPIIAAANDRLHNRLNINKKIRLIPISAGTTIADLAANEIELVKAINKNATTIVDGRVPNIPPTFVPYRSAIKVIMTTITADIAKGTTVCNNMVIIELGGSRYAI